MMSDAMSAQEIPDEAAVESLADRLESFAGDLPERERRLLMLFMVGAMDPIERLRYLEPGDVLSDREEAILRALDAQTARE